jgi:hypothetical protein
VGILRQARRRPANTTRRQWPDPHRAAFDVADHRWPDESPAGVAGTGIPLPAGSFMIKSPVPGPLKDLSEIQ